MLENFTREQWQELVTQSFTVQLGADTNQDWQLNEVRIWGDADAERHARAPFTLCFRGPQQPFAGQGTYQLRHAEYGTMEMFLVPTGPDGKDGMCYEAVFA